MLQNALTIEIQTMQSGAMKWNVKFSSVQFASILYPFKQT